MSRDLRIDFIRGFVLLLIVADHVLHNDVRWFSFTEWLFFDGAAAFVFMSGLVCGMVYSKVLNRTGWVDAQFKAIKRATQLYVAQIVMLVVVCVMFLGYERFKPLDAGPFGLAAMFEHTGRAVPNALLLVYTPWLMDILKLYIALLLLLPSMLWLYQRSRLAAALLSFSLYAFAQKFPEISPREYPHGHQWFWNPLAWQLLFFGAAAIGFERARGTLRLPRSPWLTAAAVGGMIVCIALCRSELLGWMWTDRQKFAPMHLISFATFAYLLSGILKADWAFWHGRIATPIIRCGRHSLPIFCFGVATDYLVSMVIEPIHDPVIESAVVAGGVGLTLLAATVLDLLANREMAVKAATLPRAIDPAAVPLAVR